MNSSRTILVAIHRHIECTLWASLSAFVLYFLIFVAPNRADAARRAENARTLKITAENSPLCEKWGMKRGTHEHTLCKMDLQNLRQTIEREFADGDIL